MRIVDGLFFVSVVGLGSCGASNRGDALSAGEAIGGGTTDAGAAATVSGDHGMDSRGSDPSGEDDDDQDTKGPIFDVYSGGTGGGEVDAKLRGTVWAPNGVIPVSGALVYATDEAPEGIPQGVYCAECEQLAATDYFTTTEPDGSFKLSVAASEAKYLVVQKGQFLRATPIEIEPGSDETLADELTTLPSANDPPNGQYIPLIAIAFGDYDRLEDGLAKFGLGDTIVEDYEERLVPGTEQFELWNNIDPDFSGQIFQPFTSQGTLAQLVGNPEEMARYHMIFVPCSSDNFLQALTPTNIQNIREWVAAGGRWYVADWANEWLVDVFPEYQELYCPWDCDLFSSYDSKADVLDADLLAWLEALPGELKDINPLNNEKHPTLYDLPKVLTVDNWSAIESTPSVWAENSEGELVDVGHKTWLEGPGGIGSVHPLTVTGQFGCGKIQFTSYHMAEFFNYVGLSPQELVLLYTILEIGVCQDPVAPPAG